MASLDEKRVYSERTGTRTALIAGDIGVVSVSVSGDRAGEFGLEHRCTARDVCSRDDMVAVATDQDVLIDYDSTGHGAAVAVGRFMGSVIAAAPDGTVSWYDMDQWIPIGVVDGPTAIDGGLIGSVDGVYRITKGDCRPVGLSDVKDIAVAGVPLAATTDGLYALGDGWTHEQEGSFRVVVGEPDGRSYAATDDVVYERAVGTRDGSRSREASVSWRPVTGGGQAVVDIATGVGLVLTIATDGTLRVNVGNGWRARALGLRDPQAVTLH